MAHKGMLCRTPIAKCLIAFGFSTIAIWFVGTIFLTSPTIYCYSKDLDLPVVKPGCVKQSCLEGRSLTRYGRYGLVENDANKIDIDLPIVVFWGDSYVEATQVDYGYRMQAVLSDSNERITSIGIGMPGRSIADYYFMIPRYERIIRNVGCHIIFLGNIGDVVPNDPSAWFSQFEYHSQKNDEIRLVEGFDSNRLKSSWIDELSYRTRIYFLRSIVRRCKNIEISMFKKAATVSKGNGDSRHDVSQGKRYYEAWRQLLLKYKTVTTKPIIFVYAPSLPSIVSNRICYEDESEKLVAAFAASCEKEGFHLINMKEVFIDNYLNTGQFPRGFSNARPSIGHLNPVGHKLVAGAVNDYLQEHPGVIHTN